MRGKKRKRVRGRGRKFVFEWHLPWTGRGGLPLLAAVLRPGLASQKALTAKQCPPFVCQCYRQESYRRRFRWVSPKYLALTLVEVPTSILRGTVPPLAGDCRVCGYLYRYQRHLSHQPYGLSWRTLYCSRLVTERMTCDWPHS